MFTKKRLHWIVIGVWTLLLLGWLFIGFSMVGSLFKVDYLKAEIPIDQLDPNWLVDIEWPTKMNCDAKKNCTNRTADDSTQQANLWLDKSYDILMKQKVAEILLTAQKDIQEPKSICFKKTRQACLGSYSLGISTEISKRRKSSLNQLLLTAVRLMAINKAREGGEVVSIPVETSAITLLSTAAALGRDIEQIPLSLDEGVRKLYENEEKEGS